MIQNISNWESEKSIFDKLSYVILFLSIFLIPFFVFPSASFLFGFSKILVLFIGVILSFVFWLIARLKEGTFYFPKHILFLFSIIVPLVYLLSSLFSGSLVTSLFGRGFESDTFSVVTILFLLFILIPLVFKSNKRIIYLYLAFLTSTILISLYQILRLIFGGDFMTFGNLLTPTSNLIGSWNDLSVFFGLVSLFSLSTLELIKTKRLIKILLYGILIVSLLFLWIINFTSVWFILGLFSLILFLYSILFRSKSEEKKNISINSLVVFVVSLVFVISGGLFQENINSIFGTSYIEARPSWGATFELSGETLKDSPILGVGPNRFSSEWQTHKPEGINETIFWNTNFNSGIGLVPSSLVTTGILGFLSWILFIGAFIILAFRKIFSPTNDPVTKFISISSFLASLYLWIFTILYVPNITLMVLAMVFSGVFISYLYKEDLINRLHLSFFESSRIGFISISLIVLLMVLSLFWGGVVMKKTIASAYFQRGLIEFNVNRDLDKSLEKINKSVNMDENDLYYRNLSQLNIIQLNVVLSQEGVSEEVIQEQFLNTLGTAIENAQRSTAIDETNFENWIALGKVYEAVVPIKVEGAYESAISSYQKAMELNPSSPAVLLMMARLEIINEDNEKAREFINLALEKKSNYTEAVFLLSQIEINEGNINEAIKSVERASIIAPNDATIFFQLGLLHYNDGNNEEAIKALERSVLLNQNYSNAKYFLGLSYSRVGRNSDAIAQFQEIEILNPNNNEVKSILNNLRSGKSPFSPEDSSPEEREDLPIEE